MDEIFVVAALVVAAVLGLIFFTGNLEKPTSEWSDVELLRRLPKYQRYTTTLISANRTEKYVEISEKIRQIEAEIARRRVKYQIEDLADATSRELKPILDRAAALREQGMTEQAALTKATEEWQKRVT